MYGRYTKDLGEYAKDEARRLKQLERQRKKDDRARDKVNDNMNWHIQSMNGICIALSIKQQWWEFSGTSRSTSQRKNPQGCFLVLAPLICKDGRRLDILSTPWIHHGSFIICHGQRHINVYKCTCLALQRFDE